MNIKKIFLNKFIAKLTLPFLLRLHNWFYKLLSRLSVLYCDGVHPKHDIIKYEKWFLENLEKNQDILEIGSHTGEMTAKLKDHVKSITGIEIVKELVKTSKLFHNYPNVKFIHADARKYEFGEQKYDLIIMSNVLEHIEFRDAFLVQLIDKIQWRHGPKFLIRVPLITRGWLPTFKKSLGIDYRLDATHFTEYTENELRNEINRAKMSISKLDIRFGEAFIVCEAKE